MGRYTTVQAFADNNTNMRTVPYDQAVGSASKKEGGVKAEKVDNPYGSTAGAGSGEFHVYRHARAREMARLKQMDEDEQQATLDAQFQSTTTQWKDEEECKTEKRRKKRQREKEAKRRKKHMKLGGIITTNNNNSANHGTDITESNPSPQSSSAVKESESTNSSQKPAANSAAEVEFSNDGSFLEQMKKRMEAEQSEKANADVNQKV
mmetsp:Transcript_17969/g.32574  ORF Transcript_17969/g.32574 Transcript_17969/m.32574 type:complete len:207 (-) Transcript_17969:322-942(-)|eukprot:CAMPEP_0198298442 /NCGR_PEP_ID=MMETSP1449-20131203/40881_1 /TAXON_ID=420275 /ORGANISM="Attheya septentrionalis, Strain CCMP2084" /LENGTH=206 /DNA_ID=CAMNT_0043999701 /DNA_START=1499 /DNA_END=2119 /DNA_ORIENTATION=-